jgi:hypothetical protein
MLLISSNIKHQLLNQSKDFQLVFFLFPNNKFIYNHAAS